MEKNKKTYLRIVWSNGDEGQMPFSCPEKKEEFKKAFDECGFEVDFRTKSGYLNLFHAREIKFVEEDE